jgi:hypothetical protein
LWRCLRIDKTMMRLLAGQLRDERAERVLFALVANLLNLERGQRTGEFDDRLPLSWLITTVIGLVTLPAKRSAAVA